MTRPTVIKQPGPPQQPRIVAVETRGRAISFDLEPGLHLLEAVRRGFAAAGFTSGVVELGAVALSPFAYVMPALSKDGVNAAFYSETFRPAGITRLEAGAMTFGRRDGAPFFHCHALWREADGNITGGHILPEETIIAEAATVTALGFHGAMFEAVPDPETNFKIFGPIAVQPSADSKSDPRVLVMRLRPNQDFIGALEAAAAAHDLRHAKVRGGVGSTIGVQLADGTVVENFATEVFVRHGELQLGLDGKPQVTLDVGLVDYTGGMASGRLVKGFNPVLMTFEIALEEVQG
jgi:predicted DNA-binding protein with PD1-like motif